MTAALAIEDLPSPNRGPRAAGAPIDTLVLHYTGMRSAAAAVARLRDPEARVSSHYVVDEDGCVLRLVPEEERAAHAGISFWRGIEGLNDRSIGIEIVNPGHEWGYRPFPPAQIASVVTLCRGILARHPIPERNVVAHSDIAPDRKQDPGELFPWAHLAQEGIGFWPKPGAPAAPAADPVAALGRIGYRLDAAPDAATLARVVAAFQRHWRPSSVDGRIDADTAAAIAAVDPVPEGRGFQGPRATTAG